MSSQSFKNAKKPPLRRRYVYVLRDTIRTKSYLFFLIHANKIQMSAFTVTDVGIVLLCFASEFYSPLHDLRLMAPRI